MTTRVYKWLKLVGYGGSAESPRAEIFFPSRGDLFSASPVCFHSGPHTLSSLVDSCVQRLSLLFSCGKRWQRVKKGRPFISSKKMYVTDSFGGSGNWIVVVVVSIVDHSFS